MRGEKTERPVRCVRLSAAMCSRRAMTRTQYHAFTASARVLGAAGKDERARAGFMRWFGWTGLSPRPPGRRKPVHGPRLTIRFTPMRFVGPDLTGFQVLS